MIAASSSAQREHQQRVETLLAEIRRRTDELRRRSVYGVRAPALAGEAGADLRNYVRGT